MVVLPRHARRRGGGNNNSHHSYNPRRDSEAYHGHPNYNAPPQPQHFGHQSLLLIFCGMGLGYIVTTYMSGVSPNSISANSLDAIVKNLEEQQRASSGDGMFNNKSNQPHPQHLSPLNMMNNQREAAALLRGDSAASSNHAMYNHRRTSAKSAEEGEEEEDAAGGDESETEKVHKTNYISEVETNIKNDMEDEEDSSEVEQQSSVAVEQQSDAIVNKQHHHQTFAEQEIVEDLSDAQQRFIETQKLIASQSIPTPTNPHVMKTPNLPDSKRKKILITGGAGFVGSHLTDKLMMEGHEVIVMDNFFTGQRKNVAHWMHHPRFSLIVHDVTEPIMLEVDEIYHLACPASPPHYQYNPVKTIKTSTMGTINMLGLAKRVKAKMLLTSTSEVYGDPQVHPQPESYWGNVNTIGPRACYDEGKRVAETMMYSYKNQNDVDVRVARIFNTFGPRMHPNDGRVVSNFIIQSLQDKPLTIYGDGSQTRSFQYVSDLVDGLHALMNGEYDMPVNLGNPDEFTVKAFAEYIKEMTESSSEISFLPATKDDPTQRKPDISTAKRELGWEPRVSVKEGLMKTISYFSRVLDEAGEIIPTGQEASRPKPKIQVEETEVHP